MVGGSAAQAAAGPHFDAQRFDDEIDRHGTPALWRQARRCPCSNARTGQATVDCPFCDGLGFLWDDGTPIVVYAPGRQKKFDYGLIGMWLEGQILMTFPSAITPAHYDQVVLTAAQMVVNDESLVRGQRDKLDRSTERTRFGKFTLSAQLADAIVNDTLRSYVAGADFTVDCDGTISWLTAGPPADTQYTLRYLARPVYVIQAARERDEHANKMPYPAIAQRLDVFTRKAVGED